MDTLDRAFWIAFDEDLASLIPLVDKIINRGDGTADDLYSSVDGLALIKATWALFECRDRLVRATQVTPEDKETVRALLARRPLSVPDATAASAEGSSDQTQVRDRLADTVANLIELRSGIEGGSARSPNQSAELDHELASATELLRLITRDVHSQDQPEM